MIPNWTWTDKEKVNLPKHPLGPGKQFFDIHELLEKFVNVSLNKQKTVCNHYGIQHMTIPNQKKKKKRRTRKDCSNTNEFVKSSFKLLKYFKHYLVKKIWENNLDFSFLVLMAWIQYDNHQFFYWWISWMNLNLINMRIWNN